MWKLPFSLLAHSLLMMGVLFFVTGCSKNTEPQEKQTVEVESKIPEGPSPEDFFEAFVDANINPDEQTWQQTHDDLFNLGEKAVAVLANGLTSKDIQTREAAAVILAELGPKSEAAKKELQACLDDESESVQVNAASTLTLLSEPGDKLIPTLKALIQSDDDVIQKTAIYSFSNLGQESLQPLLELATNGKKQDARLDALRAIANLGKEATSIRDAIQKLAESEEEPEEIQKEAQAALEKIPE